MSVRIDWSKRAEYIRSRHNVESAWADEAVDDDHAVWLRPDPASRTGRSVRVIGYSSGAQEVITVILVDAAVDQTDEPDGDWWGSNAWVAGPRDRGIYGKEDR